MAKNRGTPVPKDLVDRTINKIRARNLRDHLGDGFDRVEVDGEDMTIEEAVTRYPELGTGRR